MIQKLFFKFGDVAFAPLAFFGVAWNWETIRGYCIFFMFAIYWCVRLYFYVTEKKQQQRKTEIELERAIHELKKYKEI
jgi:hypothetical protein